jgi:hypothetical protein
VNTVMNLRAPYKAKWLSASEEGVCSVQLLNVHSLNQLTLAVEKSRDSSVGIALGYGLDDRGYKARFPA